MRDLGVLLRRLARDPELPRWARLLLPALALYLLSPIDLIPDVVPVLGYLDDVVIAGLVVWLVVRAAGVERLHAHWPGEPERLDALLRHVLDPRLALADLLRASFILGIPVLAALGREEAAIGMAGAAAIATGVRLARPPAGLDLLFTGLLAVDVWLTATGAMAQIDERDRLGHLLLPAAITPLLAHAACRAGVLRLERPSLAAIPVVAALGMALGVAWELVEWAADAWLGTTMSLSKADTLTDLACDAAGSLAAATALVLARRRRAAAERAQQGVTRLRAQPVQHPEELHQRREVH